jgi:hypothetical protein
LTEPATVQDRRADREEAQIAALEAAVAAAATAGLAGTLAAVARALQDAFRGADPGRWLTVRRAAARTLRGIRPDVASRVVRLLPRAAQLGAAHVGAALPAGHDPAGDPLTRRALDGLDEVVRARLAVAAAVLDETPPPPPPSQGEPAAAPVAGRARQVPPRPRPGRRPQPAVEITPPGLEDVLGKVDAPRAVAEATAGDVVARAVAGGARAAADDAGIGLVWWSERTSCNNCNSMTGAVAGPGGKFRPVRQLAARPLPWMAGGVDSPPLHPNCRCHLRIETPGLADALRREAEREVARGESGYDSLPARLAAVDRLLREGSRLPRSVQARAGRDLAARRFSRRDRQAG